MARELAKLYILVRTISRQGLDPPFARTARYGGREPRLVGHFTRPARLVSPPRCSWALTGEFYDTTNADHSPMAQHSARLCTKP
jgi:hypothetical protein